MVAEDGFELFGSRPAVFIGAITCLFPSHYDSRHQAPDQEHRNYNLRHRSQDRCLLS